MANVELSARVKRLAKDFAIENGHLSMSDEKVKEWARELQAVPSGERLACGEELVALALRFEQEGGDGAAMAAAQLYVLAAGLLGGSAAAVKRAAASGGWGAKKK